MRQKSKSSKEGAEATVRDIRRQTRKQYSAEEKIRIVLECLRGAVHMVELAVDHSVPDLFRYVIRVVVMRGTEVEQELYSAD